jgi:G5 domain
MNRWFMRRSMKVRMAMIVVATFFVFSAIGVLTASREQPSAVKSSGTVQSSQKDTRRLSDAESLAETRTEIETTEEEVPFGTSTTYDGTLPKDTTITRVEGAKGKKVIRTEVKYRNGVETSRQLISETVTVPAVGKVVAVGTRVVKPQVTATTTETPDACEKDKEEATAACEDHASRTDPAGDQ